MQVVGLDLSLTSTGVATSEGVFSLKPKVTGIPRLGWLRDEIARHIVHFDSVADLVVLEGYGFHGRHSPGHSLGELGGVVKLWLHEARVPYAIVTPQHLKLYATGKGNASKDAVLIAAVKRFAELEFRSDDEADAMWLYAMGKDWLGQRVVAMPMQHQIALAKVEWPLLETIA